MNKSLNICSNRRILHFDSLDDKNNLCINCLLLEIITIVGVFV